MGAPFIAALAVSLAAPTPLAEPARAEAGAPAHEAAALVRQGTSGGLELPSLAITGRGLLALGLGLDFYRGSFLLPGATVTSVKMVYEPRHPVD